jgi:hypothetical protein
MHEIEPELVGSEQFRLYLIIWNKPVISGDVAGFEQNGALVCLKEKHGEMSEIVDLLCGR